MASLLTGLRASLGDIRLVYTSAEANVVGEIEKDGTLRIFGCPPPPSSFSFSSTRGIHFAEAS